MQESTPDQAKREAIVPPGYKWVTNQRKYEFLDLAEEREQREFLANLSQGNELLILPAFDRDGSQIPQMEAVYVKPISS